ncbi:MAG: hypothetical protein MR051_00915 [Lentisphaeria bacterium]|nr:hypothetical protein [Lentisphaeria bacterium]
MDFKVTEFDLTGLAAMRRAWAEQAESLRREPEHRDAFPRDFVRTVPDETAYQGVRAETVGGAEELPGMEWPKKSSLILDFGEHHVGYFEFTMHTATGYCDSPVSLRLLAAELPYELEYRSEDFKGKLSQGWIQEEYIKIDVLPGVVRLPRRYACRYLRIDVIATPNRLVFDRVRFDTVAAHNFLPETPAGLTPEERELHTAAGRTLRDCMQTCFEDGPKRDRRLWLGDLYLQAKCNAVTYRDNALVERSICLLAANTNDFGMIATCAFEYPGMLTNSHYPDYMMLFNALLLDHLQEYGNKAFVAEFYPLAVQQLRVFRGMIAGEDCTLHRNPAYRLFIDHCPGLEIETPEICVYIFALKHAAELARALGYDADAAALTAEAVRWHANIRHAALDAETGLLVSGRERQVSEASQIWGVLSGVFSADEGRAALTKMKTLPGVVTSSNPYLLTYLLEAYDLCGMEAERDRLLHDYWGGMVRLGADTFWEMFNPDDLHQQLYGDAYLLSACHAWSCAPCLYLSRKSRNESKPSSAADSRRSK